MGQSTVTYQRVIRLEESKRQQLACVMACDGDESRTQELVDWLATEFASLDHDRRMYILAKGDEAVIGFVRLWHSPYINEWLIDGLVVDPPCRRRSVGRRLLTEALELATQHGAASVIAHVLSDNFASIRLHEQLGFVRETQTYRNSYGQSRSGVGWQYRVRLPAVAFRRLRDGEMPDGHSILCEAFDWLRQRGIRQWTSPLPLAVYEQWQRIGGNYGLFVGGKMAVVLSLVEGPIDDWAGATDQAIVLWLHAAATAPDFRGRRLGKQAVLQAQQLARQQARDLYVTCVHGSGFLPAFYQALDFEVLRHEMKEYEPWGTFDMVLLRSKALGGQQGPRHIDCWSTGLPGDTTAT